MNAAILALAVLALVACGPAVDAPAPEADAGPTGVQTAMGFVDPPDCGARTFVPRCDSGVWCCE